MTSGNDELNGLGYVSSAPDFTDLSPKTEVNSKDITDISTLEQVALLLRDRKAYYNSNESIVFGRELTVENQHLVNNKVVFHLQEIESLIIGAIKNVKEINK